MVGAAWAVATPDNGTSNTAPQAAATTAVPGHRYRYENVKPIEVTPGNVGAVFEGFVLDQVNVGDVTLRVRYGGAGAPIVLLHGHPRTHTTWHAVAPRLAEHHVVVAPDLRGYGQSSLPPDEPDHAQSSKRAMANDVLA